MTKQKEVETRWAMFIHSMLTKGVSSAEIEYIETLSDSEQLEHNELVVHPGSSVTNEDDIAIKVTVEVLHKDSRGVLMTAEEAPDEPQWKSDREIRRMSSEERYDYIRELWYKAADISARTCEGMFACWIDRGFHNEYERVVTAAPRPSKYYKVGKFGGNIYWADSRDPNFLCRLAQGLPPGKGSTPVFPQFGERSIHVSLTSSRPAQQTVLLKNISKGELRFLGDAIDKMDSGRLDELMDLDDE